MQKWHETKASDKRQLQRVWFSQISVKSSPSKFKFNSASSYQYPFDLGLVR